MNRIAFSIFVSVIILAMSMPGEARPRPYPKVPAQWYDSTCQVTSSGVVVGSGVCVAKDTIVTAAHVLVGSEIGVQYRIDSERWNFHTVEIGKVDAVHDAAVLHVKFCKLRVAPLGKDTPTWGEPVVIVGCPQRHEPLPFVGHWGEYVPPWVENFRPGLRTITAPNWVGSSGAPVWDLNERAIVGITSCKDSQFDHLTYIVPIQIIKGLLDSK